MLEVSQGLEALESKTVELPKAAEESAGFEFEAVELPEGYEPNPEIQLLISESLEGSSTIKMIDLDDNYD